MADGVGRLSLTGPWAAREIHASCNMQRHGRSEHLPAMYARQHGAPQADSGALRPAEGACRSGSSAHPWPPLVAPTAGPGLDRARCGEDWRAQSVPCRGSGKRVTRDHSPASADNERVCRPIVCCAQSPLHQPLVQDLLAAIEPSQSVAGTQGRRLGELWLGPFAAQAHGGVLAIEATSSAAGTGGASSSAWNFLQALSDRTTLVRLRSTSCAWTLAHANMNSVRF